MTIYLPNIKSLKDLINSKSIKKIFIITGQNSYFKSHANQTFQGLLKQKNLKFFFKKGSIPEYLELKTVIHKLRSFHPDLILAIGGGCAMDYAKSANALSFSKDIKNSIIHSNLTKKKQCKLVAIPTTAGSGAEVTSNAVIYINKKKYSVEGSNVKPDYYFIFPKLILSSGRKFDASAGFDAISQAIESMFAKKSNSQSYNHAKKALKILLKNYISFLNKKNLKNSYKMALGANFSGKAINISKTIAPHAVSYPFTSFFNIPHGHAVSLTINKFLKFNFDNLQLSNISFKKRYDDLFLITKTKNIFELDNYLNNIKKKAKLEQSFKKLKIDLNKDSNKILSGINEKRLSNNPIKVDKKDVKFIIENY